VVHHNPTERINNPHIKRFARGMYNINLALAIGHRFVERPRLAVVIAKGLEQA
jgi:hypothetical protein